ncbi:hypothetical protein DDD64_01995 [Actinotignum sanguinis]|uniref:hypothetical protein n=1 Tax=Actinotignum sanguinis TaxID=1445614 RepID=UPI000F7F477C|nr:hypothetical protein [Actinotignum sanguinis]MDY5148461.1 hypothetical protein [Actinotignum sanguinis]RTE51200.1 hypothetical protein DDD64_01995 [Actinotignum sanguinis]
MIITFVVMKGRYTPEKKAEEYLAAVVDGKISEALEIYSPNVNSANRALLTDEVYAQATNRPTGYEILETTQRGDMESDRIDYIVHAEWVIDSRRYPVEVILNKDGKTLLFFDNWKVREAPVGSLPITTTASQITVNGTTIDLPGKENTSTSGSARERKDIDGGSFDRYRYPAFPGAYTVAVPPVSSFITFGEQQVVTVIDFSEETGHDTYVSFSPSFTPEVSQKVEEQITAQYAKCMESTEVEVPECPRFNLDMGLLDQRSDARRSWSKDPKFTLDEKYIAREGDSWIGRMQVEGEISIAYKQRYRDSQPWEERSPQIKYINQTFEFAVKGDQVTLDPKPVQDRERRGWF